MRHLKPALVYCLILVGCLICPQLSLAGTIDLGGGGSSGSGGVGDRAKTSATIDSLLACEDQTNNICRVESQWEYETVAAFMAWVHGSGLTCLRVGPPPGWPWKTGMAFSGSDLVSGITSNEPLPIPSMPLVP